MIIDAFTLEWKISGALFSYDEQLKFFCLKKKEKEITDIGQRGKLKHSLCF